MPVITFLSTKGGVGKTTAAMLLAGELAQQASVTVIDIDPNQPFSNWAKQKESKTTLTIVNDATQDNIDEKIAEARAKAAFVIVDCEGVASILNSYAAAEFDLVIIPTQGSHLDAKEAAKSIKLVSKLTNRVPFGVLLTRTNPALRTRTLRSIEDQFLDNEVPLFETQLTERDAYKAIFSFGKSIAELDPGEVPNIPKAARNARLFAAEVVEVLKRVGEGVSPFPNREKNDA